MTDTPWLGRTQLVTRKYGIDLLAGIFLFLVVCVAAGRVDRFAFDDEVFNLNVAEFMPSFRAVLSYFLLGGDAHPPLSYALHYLLGAAGLGETGMRAVSLALTGCSLALTHAVALYMAEVGPSKGASPGVRISAVLLFGLNSLAVSQGDALRWYPMFSFLVASFIALYLIGGERRLVISAIPLGLAASTNFLALFVYRPFAVYRYGLQRRFDRFRDLAFHGLLAVFAVPGLITFASLIGKHSLVRGAETVQFSNSAISAMLIGGLGFFGGNILGVSQSWMAVLFALVTVLALTAAVNRRVPAAPVNFLLLLVWLLMVMVFLGFSKSRSFLYVAPIVSAVLTYFLSGLEQRGRTGAMIGVMAAAVAASVAAIANLNGTTHPFKRNASVPFEQAVDFIRANRQGPTLILSTDPVLARELRLHDAKDGSCVSYLLEAQCLKGSGPFGTVFVISGLFDLGADSDRVKTDFDARVVQIGQQYQKLAVMPLGIDDDAALKSRLAHVPLSRSILTLSLYKTRQP